MRTKQVERRTAKRPIPRTKRPIRLQGTLESDQTLQPAPERESRTLGEVMVEGLRTNAATAARYSKMLGEPDFDECIDALVSKTGQVESGNLSNLEAMLTAQAVTLNAMFTQFGVQASMVTNVDHVDRFTRMALKAQSQCRSTIETLALMKNPPAVFARQANISHGPQQVNNGTMVSVGPRAGAHPRAQNFESEENRLLEREHGERLDIGSAKAAGRRDPAVAPVAALHGTANS